MTEFEYYEALIMSVELGALASMNFLAIVAMYLIAAHVAGRKLPRSVAVGTSVIYTMFLMPPFGGTIGNIARGSNLASQASMKFPESVLFPGSILPVEAYFVFFGIPMFAGWLGSIYFMHMYVRREH